MPLRACGCNEPRHNEKCVFGWFGQVDDLPKRLPPDGNPVYGKYEFVGLAAPSHNPGGLYIPGTLTLNIDNVRS